MSVAIALSDEQWELVADLFDPPGRRGAPAVIPRRQMVDAVLFIGRTGCRWRYLPERYGAWTAVWAQWRRRRAHGVWPHDVVAARDLLRERIEALARLRAIVGERAYRGLASLAERKHFALDINAPPKSVSGFTPLWPLYKVEHAIAQLGRWRRLSRCCEGTEASARAWLEVAAVGYLAGRAVV